jgi:ATP-binding cassette subfamily B protein
MLRCCTAGLAVRPGVDFPMSITTAASPTGAAATPPGDDVPAFHIPTARLLALVPQAQQQRSTLGSYFALMGNKRRILPLVALLINLRHAPAYLQPMLYGYLVNLLVHHPGAVMAKLPWVLSAAIGLGLVNISTTLPQRLLLARHRRSLTASLRRALMHRIHRLTFAFHDRSQVGELTNKFVGDMGKLEALQSYIFETLLLQSFAVSAMIVILAYKNWHLLLLMLIAVPVNLGIYRLFWKPIRAQNEVLRKAESGFSAFLFEALSGVRVTRSHAVEDHAEDRLGGHASNVAAKGYRLDKLHAFFGSVAWASTQMLNMAVLTASVLYCVHGWIQVGDLLVIMAFYQMISQGIDAFLNGMPAIAAAHDAMTSLAELFAREDHEDDQGKPAIAALRGEISLRDVSFRYPNSQVHSLNGISLEIPAGSSVALVGPSGSGKSTTASLILGFYQPTSGTVAIDGHDLQQVDRRSIRRQVGVVSQDVMLFHDSILGNIAWGDPQPDAQRAEVAARQANAHEFIAALEKGYAHVLGDRGAGLSGGQRQRLAIARALYRDPRLLLLDEATSALDPESERVVQQALEVLMEGRTTVIIAHRLSTVRNADRIVVLDQGRVVESGSFAELMAKRGTFFELASGQLF